MIRSSTLATSPVMKDIRYYYDASGRPVAIHAYTRTSSSASFTDTTYYLQTNLQGDVVRIYNTSGTKIYSYAYDAWGNIIKSSQVATGGNAAHAVNPFRYRGYYYDTETGLYYLQSRYYNPEWGRFLNADVYVNANGDLTGYNMYAYCSNNPTAEIDPSGYQTISIGINFLGTLIGGASYTYNLSFDFRGNVGIQRTEANIFKKQSGGIFGIVDLAINPVFGVSDLDTIYDLEKESYSADISFRSIGVELVSTDINDLTGSFHGVNVTIHGRSAIPFSVNGHVTIGITETVASFNIPNVFKSAWKEVKSWFS